MQVHHRTGRIRSKRLAPHRHMLLIILPRKLAHGQSTGQLG